MPSLIGAQLGGGATGTVAQNYRRHFAPYTRFSTREVAIFQISVAGLSTDTLIDEELVGELNPYFYPDSPIEYETNGYFAQAVQAVQTQAEVLAVFRPGDGRDDNDGNSFIVMVSADTANTGNENLDTDAGQNDMAQSIADAVGDALNENTDVYHMRIRGGDFRYSDLNGLSTDDRSQAAKVSHSK
jgi:hypothetical protein